MIISNSTTFVIQYRFPDGTWVDWALGHSEQSASKRIEQLNTERPHATFRIIRRETIDTLYEPEPSMAKLTPITTPLATIMTATEANERFELECDKIDAENDRLYQKWSESRRD